MVFPGVQGGPLMHVIAAKAACFGEALKPSFKEVPEQIVKNADTLAQRLKEHGYRVVSGGTEKPPHACRREGRKILMEEVARHALDQAGITVNKNSIPFDTESPFKAGELGSETPAVTTRSMKEPEMLTIADFIDRGIEKIETIPKY